MTDTKTQEQSIAFRREIRSRYKELANKARDEKHVAAKATTGRLLELITTADELRKNVEKPREQVADTGFLRACAEIGLEMAQSLVDEHQGRTAQDFIDMLLANNTDKSFNWARVGDKVSKYFKTAPGVSCMLGAMEAKVKERKVSVRRERQKLGAETTPEELEGMVEADKQETDRNMEEMWQILNNCDLSVVSVANLVCNHSSFCQTVENIFTLSFLVRDQRVRVQCCPDLGLVVKPLTRAELAAHKGGEPAQQFVLSFDMGEWETMKTVVAAGECMMRHRHTVNPDVKLAAPPSASPAMAEAALGDITNKRMHTEAQQEDKPCKRHRQ